ncbi:MAG: type II toxin-antitoxin system Phd/YefM family antitoxin [Chloroflexota bacterium]|nr:type II toxin-antitoxin system Phd/YefM family antitoxin [Chloroflexota bacterium]MDE2841207.1 type II toxin-antitoxin system Phd/YefM family antitoxin [Chloroflexota bacterium]MDE2929607.1 type II toxin-antitoxin system Phd/YefM family antitoxin [Chloroflexota bacterium]
METDSERADGGMGAPGGALPAEGIQLPSGARVVKASEFKAKCLRLMDEVAASGEEIIITKRGRPVSRLAPYREKSKLEFGRNRDNIRCLDDIVEPMPADWFEDGDAGENLF